MVFWQKVAIVLVILTVLSTGIFFLFDKDRLDINDEEIINILKKNPDGLSFIEKYKDFKIEEKKVLNEGEILSGQNGKEMKQLYFNLDQENNRYLRLKLTSGTDNVGLIAVLDVKNKEPVNVFGIMLLKVGSGANNLKP